MMKDLHWLKKMKTALILFFIFICQLAWSQQTISGKVTDDTASPLPGVNIIVEGTGTGTTTDADGKFSLSVSRSDAVLIFSFIGYTTQRIPVGTQTVFDVAMAADLTTLEEVVVVG